MTGVDNVAFQLRESDTDKKKKHFSQPGYDEIAKIIQFAVCHKNDSPCHYHFPDDGAHASVVHVGCWNGDPNQEWMTREKAKRLTFEETVKFRDGQNTTYSLPNSEYLYKLERCMEDGAVILDCPAPTMERIINDIGDALVSQLHISGDQKPHVIKALLLNNRSFVGNGSVPEVKDLMDQPESTIAIIGSSVQFLESPVMAFVRLSELRNIGNIEDVQAPIRFIIVYLNPRDTFLDYNEMGRAVTALMTNKEFEEAAIAAKEREDMVAAVNDYVSNSISLPPGEFCRPTLLPFLSEANLRHRELESAKQKAKEEAVCIEKAGDEEPKEKPKSDLDRTGRFFGGMINDIKRRYPYYWSDIRDGLNVQCLSVAIFIYFACLSPAITYGGLLGDITGQLIGIGEMLMMTGISGIIFSLFSCQPISIIGATGPVVVFERALVSICETLDIPFLATRCWVGIWVFIIAFFLTMFDGSSLVKFITRFVQEIFGVLVSFIYIIEVFFKLADIFGYHPLKYYYTTPAPPLHPNFTTTTMAPGVNATEPYDEKQAYPNTALFSLVLCFSTFFIAFYMKKFRNSHFLGHTVRRTLGDFGVPIAILVMCLVDALWVTNVYTEKLIVPDGFAITSPDKRDFFINPVGQGLPYWVIAFSLVVALLVFVLIFINSQVCFMIINKKERNLKKGSGYHIDMLLVGVFGILSGVFGFPWVVGATVRGVTHITACTKTESVNGQTKVVGAHEQRLTNLVVHILILLSVFLGPVLRLIPYAVLYGIFLYMGVASLMGVQMCERMVLIAMPKKYHWNTIYTRHVPVWKMHLWTIIQVVSVALLWGIQLTPAALAFPFILILLVPIRLNLFKHVWNKHERQHLDNKGEDPHKGEVIEDFYVQAANIPHNVDH